MFVCEIADEFSHRPSFAALGLLKAPIDASDDGKKFLVVHKLLIRGRALNHHFSMAIHRQNTRLARRFELPNMGFDVALEVTKRVDITER